MNGFLLFFLLLVRFILAGAASDSPASIVSPIPKHLYHTSDSLLKEVKSLVHRHPERLSMETVRAGNKGYDAEITIVTYNSRNKQMDDRLKSRILLSFGQHGRELITCEVALRLLSVLTEEHRLHNIDAIFFKALLDSLVIKVVPMENLNGRKLVEAGDHCERRNGRGVDLNRNWGVDWGKKEKDYNPYEENPGTAPFSEPEAQIMRKLAISFNPHIWVNVHSGVEALFMPYDHKNTTPDGFMAHIMGSILHDLNLKHCQNRCLVGSGGGSVGYLAHGTSTDYMYDILKVPMSFTFEIYGNTSASSKECFQIFNPVDKTTFDKVVENWCAALLMLFMTGPTHIDKANGELFSGSGKLVPMSSLGDITLTARSMGSKEVDGLDLEMQDMRAYFRLFVISSLLILFMFFSRISKGNFRPTMPSTGN